MSLKLLTEDQKRALAVLRERIGGVSAEKQAHLKEVRQARKAITDALVQGPATVPVLAAATGLPTDVVLWHLTAMRKYGGVHEADADGDYISYTRAEEEPA